MAVRFAQNTRCIAGRECAYHATTMNLHEYQAKELFQRYGVAVPRGRVAASPAEAAAAAEALGGALWVVKAQVHAGGRGKAGGVKLCRSVEEVRGAAQAMLGQRLVTPQTGAGGLPVHQVYVEQGSSIARELYLSLLLNRDRSRLAFIASVAGGMDIEEVAAHTPEKIAQVEIHPAVGLSGVPVPRAGLRPRPGRDAGGRVREDRARHLPAVHRAATRAWSR